MYVNSFYLNGRLSRGDKNFSPFHFLGEMEQYSVSTLHCICFIGTERNKHSACEVHSKESSICAAATFSWYNKLFIDCIVMLCDPEIVTVLCNRYAGTVCL